jgi:DNA-binding transcriptional ArsR family regulator
MKTILPAAPIISNRWVRPAVVPRSRSRRREPKLYHGERLGTAAARQRRAQHEPPYVHALADAGRTGSALRRSVRAAGIDPRLARLVLLFYRRDSFRVADVAWSLNISPSTASRWLDRAEQAGLVDKQYDNFDRRGTWARLTTSPWTRRTAFGGDAQQPASTRRHVWDPFDAGLGRVT